MGKNSRVGVTLAEQKVSFKRVNLIEYSHKSRIM